MFKEGLLKNYFVVSFRKSVILRLLRKTAKGCIKKTSFRPKRTVTIISMFI